jgi:hypothetical protein
MALKHQGRCIKTNGTHLIMQRENGNLSKNFMLVVGLPSSNFNTRAKIRGKVALSQAQRRNSV